MKKQYDIITNCIVSEQNVLVRCDLNTSFDLNGEISDYTRLEKAIETISYLVKNNAKIVICTHIGNPDPNYGFNPEFSTTKLIPHLSSLTGKEIKYIKSYDPINIQSKLDSMQYGEIMLLENIRFNKEEKTNDLVFAKNLASNFNLYVNEAFSCSHRKHASIDGITNFIKSVAGINFVNEQKNIDKILYTQKNHSNSTAIIGGSKIETKIGILKNLVIKLDNLIIGGALLNTFLYALGYQIGKSKAQKNSTGIVDEIMQLSKEHNCKILIPNAIVVENSDSQPQVKLISDVNQDDSILDVDILDPRNASIIEVLEKSSIILWNGPVGYNEKKPFDKGSFNLSNTIADLTLNKKIFSIAGGGDAVSCINNANRMNDFSFVSTAGGAFLEYLEKETLIGIEAMSKNLKEDLDINAD